MKTQYNDKPSRDTGNIGHTRHSTKTNNPETRGTLATQDTVRRQTIQRHGDHWSNKTHYNDKPSKDTGNIGPTRHSTKKNHPETQGTLVTQDTVRRQTIQRHREHGSHNIQYNEKPSRDTGNIGHTRHSKKTNNL